MRLRRWVWHRLANWCVPPHVLQMLPMQTERGVVRHHPAWSGGVPLEEFWPWR